MKVAIIAFNNMKYSPYVKTYSDYLDKLGIEYNVIYPKREEISDNLVGEHYPIKWNPQKKKFWNFIKFRNSASRILKRNKYDFVIVLTTFPAVLLANVLRRRYKGRYLVDVRDYTHESNRFYFYFEKKALLNSKINVISSPAFKTFLPESNYILCHNMPSDYDEPINDFDKKEGKIVIGYVGSIGYKPHCRKLIDLVEKDDRFCFHFYGNEKGTPAITEYVDSLNNDRIKCFGAYDPKQKKSIVESVDILFNVYGNESALVKNAISNKLYDSFYFKKPLLTSSNTIMSELAGDFSFDLDKCNGNLDEMYCWYNSIDEKSMVEYMNEKMCLYFEDMRKFDDSLKGILEEMS